MSYELEAVKEKKMNEIQDMKTLDQTSQHSISTKNQSQISYKSIERPIDTFSVYSSHTRADSEAFKETYKKVALVLESLILVAVLIIILKKVSLYEVFNVVTAVCYPTICLIVPSYFYSKAIRQDRPLTMTEHASVVGVTVIGVLVLVISIYNLFF